MDQARTASMGQKGCVMDKGAHPIEIFRETGGDRLGFHGDHARIDGARCEATP